MRMPSTDYAIHILEYNLREQERILSAYYKSYGSEPLDVHMLQSITENLRKYWNEIRYSIPE